MVENANVTAFDLDMDIDSLPDLAEFLIFPTGAYHVTMESWESKVLGDHPAITQNWKLKEVVEVKEKLGMHPVTSLKEEPPKPGDVMGTAYMTDNEVGKGYLKRDCLLPIAEKFGKAPPRQLLDTAKGKDAMIIVAREWNEDKKRYYGKIVNTVYL